MKLPSFLYFARFGVSTLPACILAEEHMHLPLIVSKKIVDALNDHFIITEGIGLELHPDNVNVETLQILKDAGVTIYRKFSCNNAQKRKAGIIGCYHKILSGQRV